MRDDRSNSSRRPQTLFTGLMLIGLGLLFLADARGWLELQNLLPYWPAIIGLLGLSQMIGARNAAQMTKGGFLVFLSIWLYMSIENIWGLNFHNSWPLILIAVGIGKIIGGLAAKDDTKSEQRPS